MITEHPTPWRIKENGDRLILTDLQGSYIVGMHNCPSQKEAIERIVRAVNGEDAHRKCLVALKNLESECPADPDTTDNFLKANYAAWEAIAASEKALEGEQS